MKKILIFEKRKKAKELHEKGWSNRKISKYIVAGKNNVARWIKLDENLILTDNSGWKKGKLRKYTQETKQGVIKIRRDLEKEGSYFPGALVVQSNYEKQKHKKIHEMNFCWLL